VMRAVRFAAALEFALDPETERGIAPALPSLARVSKERVSDELRKILATRAPSRALAIAERTGILALILPEVAAGIDAWAAALGGGRGVAVARWLGRIDAAAPAARLGALVAVLADPDPAATQLDRGAQRRAEAVLKRLKFSNEECAAAAVLVGAAAAPLVDGWTDVAVRRLIAEITRRHAPAAVALWRADGAAALADRAAVILARRDALASGELAVTGKDLMVGLSLSPGPAIGRLLGALLDRVLVDPTLNTPDQLLALARGLAQTTSNR